MNHGFAPRITDSRRRQACCLWLLLALLPAGGSAAEKDQRALFTEAWEAARRGDHAVFREIGPELDGYLLQPYWQYEDYRSRRSRVPADEMAAFLDAHADYAFTSGLRTAWLKSLAERGRWQELLAYGGERTDTELRCQVARARLAEGRIEGLAHVAERLWAAPASQPDACDPVFDWLVRTHGISESLAWERIRLAFEAGNPRFTLYLARFLPSDSQRWLERWQALNRDRYRGLERAATWPDNEVTRMITSVSLGRLAHHDAAAAMRAFERLDGHFQWGEAVRGEVLREIALMGAVELHPDGLGWMSAVPPAHRNQQLLEWWVRLGLAQGNWTQVLVAIGQMDSAEAEDDRWRYWQARAWEAQGEKKAADTAFRKLAARANYYGFLAADRRGDPYTICPLEPQIPADEVAELMREGGFARALELRAVGLDNWALAEWAGATKRLPTDRLKVAAALAMEVGWHDRAIHALGDSGELRFYAWRFPLLWQEQVQAASARHGLDPAWILGLMRSESAMTETARSSAGALGLMQVTPGTARQIANRHGMSYRGQSQLLDGDENIRFGTVYLADLLGEFRNNPVLVAGAYNAGPHVVRRWLGQRDLDDPTVWVETLPYFETRDYIPRVLAFTTLYNWRLGQPVQRVSRRMPGIESGNMAGDPTTEVVCRAPQMAGP